MFTLHRAQGLCPQGNYFAKDVQQSTKVEYYSALWFKGRGRRSGSCTGSKNVFY
jgi:hypothetical protein